MEFKNTLEIVTKDIQDIEKLVSNFKNYSSIPNIELDLALSRLRNVYDLLLLFREESGNKNILPETPVENKKDLHKGKEHEAHANTPPDHEDLKESIPNVPRETKTKESEKTAEPVAELKKESDSPEPSVVTKNKDSEKIYIHEHLGKQHGTKKDISTKLQGQAIKSIAASIGINDKFFFIRELFAGNAETFRQTMEELDHVRNFNEAYSMLLDRFAWDMESEPVQTLLNLIRRKFIPSGNE